MAKATCVKESESNPCSMKVAEVLICERSRPETGTSRSSTREAMRSCREDGMVGELPEATLSVGAEEATGSTNRSTVERVAETEFASGRLCAAATIAAGSTQKRCRSKG